MLDRNRVNVMPLVLTCAAVATLAGGIASADVFYGVTNNGSANSNLVRFDTAAQTCTIVGPTTTLMEDCDFDASGTLWSVRQGNAGGFPPTIVSQAYSINLATGAATLHGDYGSTASLQSLAYRSSSSSFYSLDVGGVNTGGMLVTTDLNAGTITPVTGLVTATPWRVEALAFAPSGALYGIWNSNSGGPFGTNMYNLVSFDLSTGARSLIGPITGVASQTFDSLRFDSAGNAYTVDFGNGDVYTVNTTTGHGTFAFAGGSAATGTRGLALLVPAPGAGVLLGLGLLAAARRRR
jgi:hypothetical protein